jgi:hypothetical protein
LEIAILIKPIEIQPGIYGNVQHKVTIFHDGSIFLKEIFSSISKDEELNASHLRSFKEFQECIPSDARLVEDWLKEHNIEFPGIKQV